jgi:hypothetical protein
LIVEDDAALRENLVERVSARAEELGSWPRRADAASARANLADSPFLARAAVLTRS